MNNVNDEFDKKESRIKLVRNESIGSYSWDSSESNINGGYGINEWSSSSVNQLLNEMYYNGNNATTSCDFTSSGLNSDAKKMITKITWNTGSNGEITYNSINSSKFYELERSDNIGKICESGDYCNDDILRTSVYTGYIGLIYPSDYGFATAGNESFSRAECLKVPLHNWENQESCSNWLYNGNSMWSMMPKVNDTSADRVFFIQNFVYDSLACNGIYKHATPWTRPVAYLKSNVKIIKGNGTKNTPFELSL